MRRDRICGGSRALYGDDKKNATSRRPKRVNDGDLDSRKKLINNK